MYSHTIDTERLRKDLLEECYGGFFVGGYGAALMESFDIEKASEEELLEIAKRSGIDIDRYFI